MGHPLISIIMSVKNAAPYLEDCLESICQQSVSNWELLISENHSTDTSMEILKKYARLDKRIKLTTNPGKYLIDSLNAAYNMSRGELITRMDADDIMVPDKLACLRDLLLMHGPGNLATGKVRYFSEGEIGQGYRNYEKWLNNLMKTGNHYQEIYRECIIPSPCWMVYREDFERAGAFGVATYPEDYDLCFRFCQLQLKIRSASKVLHLWRDYSSRASRVSPEYSDNLFLDLKLSWFIRLNYDASVPLVLWGAGRKGKWMARWLADRKVPFIWVTNNEKKIGLKIYSVRLLAYEGLKNFKDFLAIISVAATADQQEVRSFLERLDKKQGKDFFFFC